MVSPTTQRTTPGRRNVVTLDVIPPTDLRLLRERNARDRKRDVKPPNGDDAFLGIRGRSLLSRVRRFLAFLTCLGTIGQ